MRGLTLAVLSLFVTALPVGADYYLADTIALELNISGEILVVPAAGDYSVRNVKAHLSYFPREDLRQEVVSMDLRGGKLADDEYVFEWKEPGEQTLGFGVRSGVKTFSAMTEVSEQLEFPVAELPAEMSPYLDETPTIDYSRGSITELANRLAAGESDMFVMAHKLAAWVNSNIEYDLNTKTAEASQKASWVLENRYGVCDEITNLFIALCRALGIPARFVSGLSYSELYPEKWSPHGWAEVYFPGHGWVPFDVTYGEFGYIDPAHIKLKVAEDANRSSSRYEWEGYNADLVPKGLVMQTRVLWAEGTRRSHVEIDAKALKQKTGPGSYNALQVGIENNHDYYVPVEIRLAMSQGIEYLEDSRRFLLVRPNSRATEFWIFVTRDNLLLGYVYNFTLAAHTAENASAKAFFSGEAGARVYSLGEIRDAVDALREEEEKAYSRNIQLECTAEQVYYVHETATVNCTVQNTGNVMLRGLGVCLKDCRTFDLGIGRSAAAVFDYYVNHSGMQDISVVAQNNEVAKRASVVFAAWEKPRVVVESLQYPERTEFGRGYQIDFALRSESQSIPADVKIRLISDSFSREWSARELSQPRKYSVSVGPGVLRRELTEFAVDVEYSDLRGNTYKTQERFSIALENVTVRDRAAMLFGSISAESLPLFAAVAFFAAGIITGYIFHRRRL